MSRILVAQMVRGGDRRVNKLTADRPAARSYVSPPYVFVSGQQSVSVMGMHAWGMTGGTLSVTGGGPRPLLGRPTWRVRDGPAGSQRSSCGSAKGWHGRG